MFPLGDEPRRGQSVAIVTLGLLAINIVVFIYQLSLGPALENFIRTYGAVPREILTGRDIPPPGPEPVWLQLLTSMFLHGGWLHLISNMAYLLGLWFVLQFLNGIASLSAARRRPAGLRCGRTSAVLLPAPSSDFLCGEGAYAKKLTPELIN